MLFIRIPLKQILRQWFKCKWLIWEVKNTLIGMGKASGKVGHQEVVQDKATNKWYMIKPPTGQLELYSSWQPLLSAPPSYGMQREKGLGIHVPAPISVNSGQLSGDSKPSALWSATWVTKTPNDIKNHHTRKWSTRSWNWGWWVGSRENEGCEQCLTCPSHHQEHRSYFFAICINLLLFWTFWISLF